MALGEIASVAVTIGAVTKPLDDALRRVKSQLTDISTKKIAIGITGLISASFMAAKSAATLAMEMHRVQTIFNTFAPAVQENITALSKAFGYARTDLADMASNLGLMFVGMGLNEKATAALANQFLKLGVNASVLYGMDLPEFMSRIEGGVAGANRGLRKMGIFINETQVRMEQFRLASQGVVWLTKEQGEQLARTSLIMRSLSASAGQATWAHQQFGGTLRETKGRLYEMWLAFGEIAKPIWTLALTNLNKILKEMGDWIDRNKDAFISFTTNIKIHAQIAFLRFQENIEKAGAWMRWFLDVSSAGLTWLRGNWQKALLDIGIMVTTAFENITGNIVLFGKWFSDNWRNLWDDMGNIVITTLRNLGENFKRFGKAAYDWIKSGFRSPFEMNMVGLGEGAAGLKTAPLPEFKALLAGFKAISDKFDMPGLPKGKLKEITDDFEKKIGGLIKKMEAPAGKKKEEAGGGIARPLMMPNVSPIMGGAFVGISEFARQMQQQMLEKDNPAAQTARNTMMLVQQQAQMLRLWQDFGMMPGIAMGPA